MIEKMVGETRFELATLCSQSSKYINKFNTFSVNQSDFRVNIIKDLQKSCKRFSARFGELGTLGRINTNPQTQGLRLVHTPLATNAILRSRGVLLSNLARVYDREIPSEAGLRKLRGFKRRAHSPIRFWGRQFQRIARRLSNLGVRCSQVHRVEMTRQPHWPPTNNARRDFQLKTAGRAATLRSGSENSWGAINQLYRVVESRASTKFAGGGS